MTTKPTHVHKDADGFELSIWPPIPGVTENPVVQIDFGSQSLSAEYIPEAAPAIAAAILAAADRL